MSAEDVHGITVDDPENSSPRSPAKHLVAATSPRKGATGNGPAAIEVVVTPSMLHPAATARSSWNVFAWPLRRKLRILWGFLVTAIFLSLPMLLWDMQEQKWAPHYQAWFFSGLFTLLTIPITLYEVALHLEYYSQPQLQKHIIRILFMPPIYALDAWFCLRFISARTWLTPIREMYEAYTVYNFLMFLIRYLESELGPVDLYLQSSGKQQPHYFPVSAFSHPWPMGKEFYQNCRKGVLNYVILRPATTVLMFVALISDPSTYEEGKFAWDNLWPYTAFINNFSQGWAIYCLFLFYFALHDELAPINPLRKMITIKLVVFFSFWQGLAITVLTQAGVLKVRSSWRTYLDTNDLAGGLQDFIICIEMLAAALAFAWSFPPRDYMNGASPGFWTTIHTLLDFRDVVDDVQGRVHEEYKEITTRPLSKIIAPIRNNPFLSARPKPFDASENEPLYAVREAPSTAERAGDACETQLQLPPAEQAAAAVAARLHAPGQAVDRGGALQAGQVELALAGTSATTLSSVRGLRASRRQD